MFDSLMDRWCGILRVPSLSCSRSHYKVAACLCISPTSKNPTVPSANAIFFNGDRVEGTGNPVIERLSDLQKIAEILVSKLGGSVNAWVIEASTFNGPFAVYKEFIPSVNKWGEPRSYHPTGYPASTSTVLLLSKFLNEVKNVIPDGPEEQPRCGISTSDLFQPKTLLFGFSKGGTVLNQLVTELACSEVNSFIDPIQDHGLLKEKILPTSKESLLNSISEIHYVDVGLNSTGAYITDDNVFKKLSERLKQGAPGIRFVLHGTPRQWSDNTRDWIRKEKDTMVNMLGLEAQKVGDKLRVCERVYFAERPPSLQMHFEIIEGMDLS